MAKSKSFKYQICHMSPKKRRSSRIQAIRKGSTKCPGGRIPKCSPRKKGYAYCGKSSRKKSSRKRSR